MMDDEHQQIGPESVAPRHIPQHDRSPGMPAPDQLDQSPAPPDDVAPLQQCERCRVLCAPGMACVSSQPGHANAERPCREPRPATWGGIVEDPKNCAYCAAWPALPCSVHRTRR